MSLVPVFEIGIWNAWIFMLINVLPMPVMMRMHKGKMGEFQNVYIQANKTRHNIMWVLWGIAFVYSVFLPLRLSTMWFFVGLPIALVGLVLYLIVIVNFTSTPFGKEPVTKGLYRYSRHPMYVTQLVKFIGVGIASASWLFLVLMISYLAIAMTFAAHEERSCLENYGDAYQQYMNRTPRWLGRPTT